MSKWKKNENPCKLCLAPVSQKNGLKCQGACKSWVHYECLNYTPGRIKDIKAGIIKISCPCPDCNSILHKEYRTDQSFTCTNTKCPANTRPKCDDIDCPVNTDKRASKPEPFGFAIEKCGKGCKSNNHPHLPENPMPHPLKPCASPHHSLPMPEKGSTSDAGLNYNKCESSCSSDVPGDYKTLEQMCNTIGQLSNQINELMLRMKQTTQNQSSDQNGPKSQLCFCPGNPGRRQ